MERKQAVGRSSISVTLRYFAAIREITGKKEESITIHRDDSVKDALDMLAEIYGEKFNQMILDEKKKLREDLTFLVNGQAVNVALFSKKKLKDGDVLAILPPIQGG